MVFQNNQAISELHSPLHIDNEWALQSHCLQAQFMPEYHTGAHNRESLLSTLEEWNLDSDKLIAITT